jgi:hypothetical protein
MWGSSEVFMSIVAILVTMLTLCIVSADSLAIERGQGTIPLDQAIRIGNARVLKMGIDLHTVEVKVDDENKEWEEYLSSLANSSVPDLKAFAKRINDKLRGRNYWHLMYWQRGFKGGGATVLVDKNSGKVLFAQRGE